MHSASRRQACLALAAAGLAALVSPMAQAAAPYPTKPVTVVTAFAAGSGPDAVLRLVADKLSRDWGQRVLVENRPGGGGFIAIEAARRAAPDGYTLLQLDSEHLAALPHLYKSRNFATLEHFDPVVILFRTPFFIAVPTDSDLKSVADLVDKAKANPGKLSYGSWSVGSPGHLGGEQLRSLTGAQMEHVPYREVSQLYTDLSTGQLDWAYGTLPSTQSVYQTGKIRYLAIAAEQRHPQQPDVPTVAEAGGPQGVYVNSFVSLVAPKGIDADIAASINAAVAKAVADPDIQARYQTFAFETLNWSPADIRAQAAIKDKQYGELVRQANISLD